MALVSSKGVLSSSRLLRSSVFSTRICNMSKLATVQVDDKTGVATLIMNRPPVNGLNLELLRDIRDSIREIEDNKSRGLILTSSSQTIFSAGLDILEMYKPNQDRLKDFWSTLQETWLALFGSSIATAALINGHSPAGGCLLALCCEYRVMLPNFTIGLNETKLGIVAPKWFMDSMENVISRRQTEMALMQGRMFTTSEALNIGLIDSVANSKEEALESCMHFLATFKGINPFARAATKLQFRGEALANLEENREKDLNKFIFFVNQASVQKSIGNYLEALKNKQKK